VTSKVKQNDFSKVTSIVKRKEYKKKRLNYNCDPLG